MNELVVDVGGRATHVHAASGVLDAVGPLLRESVGERVRDQCVLITDRNVQALYAERVEKSLAGADAAVLTYAVEPGEQSKSWASAGDLHRFMADRGIGRDATIVALGGGMVGDLAGFVAATWMRGIRLVTCPTTLEAMIDACVGGKTAIDLPQGKNLVGAFHPASLVAIDPACLRTLPPRDVRAGLAESVKHALISSEEFLAWHERTADAILALDESVLLPLVLRNLQIKAAVVTADPFERTGKRMTLNFGHTIGHAIEVCCGYSLRHGECVALGMLAACRISRRIGLLEGAVPARVEALLSRLGLPTRLSEPIPADRVIDSLRLDKKVAAGTVQFVLLEAVGRPTIRDDVPDSLIDGAIDELAGH